MDEEVPKKEDKQEETEEVKPKPDNEPEKVKEDVQEAEEKEKKDKFEKVKKYKNNLTGKMRENPWIASTFLLGIFMLIILITGFSGITGGTVSENEVSKVVLEFVNSQIDGEAELVEINFDGVLYEVVVLFEGREIPIYITADGKNLVQGVTPLDSIMQQNQQSEGYSEEDWTIFENELPFDMESKILSFDEEEPVNSDEIFEFKNYDLISNTLIVFYSPGCGWCTKYYPILIEAKEQYPKITIYALELNDNMDIAGKYGARGTPANVINGKYFISGYMSIEDLSEILDKLL